MYHERCPTAGLPKLIVLRQITMRCLASVIAVMIGFSICTPPQNFSPASTGPTALPVPAALLVTGIVFVFIIPARSALGYLENRDDLLLRCGILFRHQWRSIRAHPVRIFARALQRAYGLPRLSSPPPGGTAAIRKVCPGRSRTSARRPHPARYQRLADWAS